MKTLAQYIWFEKKYTYVNTILWKMNNTCRVCKQILLIQVLKDQNYLGTIYLVQDELYLC